MANSKDPIQIPLPVDEAIRLAMKVKPTADMPRPGAQATTAKKKTAKKKG